MYSKQTWRSQCAEKVLERIDRLVVDFGVNYLDFFDDAFFTDPQRVEKIANGLVARNRRLKWFAQGGDVDRVAGLDDAYLKLLESSGCKIIRMGAESGSAKILKSINKTYGIEELFEINRRLKKYSIAPWYYFTIGMPGETKYDLKQSVALIFRLLKENPRARLVATFCITPQVGTRLLAEAQKQGFFIPDSIQEWAKLDGTSIITPWFDEKTKKRLNFLFFTSLFVDKKNREILDSPALRMLAEIYRPLAAYRMKNLYFKLPFEYILYNLITGR